MVAFEIAKLPSGDWTFQVWHESGGFITDVTQDGESVVWQRGRFTQSIAEGTEDLGDILISPTVFD